MDENAPEKPSLTAFRLSEEKAAAGYLAARREMVALAARMASVRQLVFERPTRADYKTALNAAEIALSAAMERTHRAFERYHRAQVRSDAHWTATQGRAA